MIAIPFIVEGAKTAVTVATVAKTLSATGALCIALQSAVDFVKSIKD